MLNPKSFGFHTIRQKICKIMKNRGKNGGFLKKIPPKYEKFLLQKDINILHMKMFCLLSEIIFLENKQFYDLFSLTQCI